MTKGIDIASYQGTPDFNKVKTSQEFVIIKASEGVGFIDPQLKRNQTEIRKVGLGLGYYHFCRPDLGNTPENEANWFLLTINGLQKGEVLALDFEVSYTNKVPWCKKFLDEIYRRTGVKALIYLNRSLVLGNNWQPIIDAGYGLWLALYDNNPNGIDFDTKWPVLAIKQYTSSGSVNGIAGNVDMNTFFGDINAFKAYGYQSSQPAPTPIPPSQPQNLTKELVKSIYQGITGQQPTEDEIAYRLKQNLPVQELINDILKNDIRAKAKWLKEWGTQDLIELQKKIKDLETKIEKAKKDLS